jgi:hypothetical protein
MSAFLRLISVVCTLVLLVSFGMFASDQAGSGSKKTVAEIGSNDESNARSGTSTEPAKKHGSVRTAIDDVNDKLVAPFNGVVATDSPWAKHISESVLAFLVFGLGVGFLARYASTRGI